MKRFCPHCQKEIAVDAEKCPFCDFDLVNYKLQCPHCKKEIPADAKQCPNCGFDTVTHKLQCPKCAKEIPDNTEKCPFCGYDIKSDEDTIEETVQLEENKISNTTNDKIAKIWCAISIITLICGFISGIVLGNIFPTKTLDLSTSIYDTTSSYTSSFNYILMIYIWLASLLSGFIFYTIGIHIQNQQQIIHLLRLQVKDKSNI